MLGHSLLTQFPDLPLVETTLPFIDTPEKAQAAVARIDQARTRDGQRPLVFHTLVLPEIRAILGSADAFLLDCFQSLLFPLEIELGRPASLIAGLTHGMPAPNDYHHRIEAINYALNHDDGAVLKNLEQADVILIGVSRSGKTPTCLYLAMQYGIFAANYPLTPDDFAARQLPQQLIKLKHKLFGLTIDPARLQQIRTERQPGTNYASKENCEFEVRQAEAMMRSEAIPFLNTSTLSIEEMATTIRHRAALYHVAR